VNISQTDQLTVPEESHEQGQSLQLPTGWAETQDSLAASTDLSLLLVQGHQPPAQVVSNNNSICAAFQSSATHASLCDPDCGDAYNKAYESGGTVHYRCHAGINCFVEPVRIDRSRKLAVIGGRAFESVADYRALSERIYAGDLHELLSDDVFKNVIFGKEDELVDLAARVASAAEVEFNVNTRSGAREQITPRTGRSKSHPLAALPPVNQGLVNLPFSGSVNEVCHAAMAQLSHRYGLSALAILQRDGEPLAIVAATGRFKTRPIRLSIRPTDPRLVQAASHSTSIVLRQSQRQLPVDTEARVTESDRVELFPMMVGSEVKGALLVGDEIKSDEQRHEIAIFCRDLSLPLEILRLREKLEQREQMNDSMVALTESLPTDNPASAYYSVLRHSAEMLRAERSSLLLFDEISNELEVKAAIGPRSENVNEMRTRLGEGVSGTVLQEGRPMVVRDVATTDMGPAPSERRYKTRSFISYPIIIGGRKIGVLNVTDKTGGGAYDDVDLSLIESIAPQMALVLDRAEWQEKAAQFELMSITDPLTGLLNRRYLEERLAEELSRSQRYGYSTSFMMIDIDDFKYYNDRNGHQAGDRALEITAQCLKASLRAADVAARYGGEEFCILLPQTTLLEAQVIAERIRRKIERQQFPHGYRQPGGSVTVSIGLSAGSEVYQTPTDVIGAADRALYVAKNRGKNRVQVVTESLPTAIPDAPNRLE
jgi:diguanylate cyclase (GGDEF)-like protein